MTELARTHTSHLDLAKAIDATADSPGVKASTATVLRSLAEVIRTMPGTHTANICVKQTMCVIVYNSLESSRFLNELAVYTDVHGVAAGELSANDLIMYGVGAAVVRRSLGSRTTRLDTLDGSPPLAVSPERKFLVIG